MTRGLRHRLCALMAWAVAPIGVPAAAQTLEPAGVVGQIDVAAPRGDRARAGQISQPSRIVTPGGIAPAGSTRRGAQPAQIAAPGDAGAPVQLTPTGRSASGPAQVAPAPRSAQAAPPLSTPAQGRTGATTRVAGRDRCDPAAKTAARVPCTTVIETRGSEFPPPGVEPLSPEQRLLVEERVIPQRTLDQQQAAGDAIARSANRRVGRDGADASAPAMQGIASIVLAPPPAAPAREDPTAGLTPEQAAAATSTLGAIGTTQP
ncbi:hypothetical protein [Sphingomonas solaris]|uniref:Uncharacterized protein n=1 Tax=Alterirhizorhabdus solaris TaxID=2529389 RepID=A0A558QUZ5_9SPHN|nr:hypothetical protein [Sphingomonas solaris]TVV70882.1 hypothetical protein FOY91_18105 [Sphingomonas solaris]